MRLGSHVVLFQRIKVPADFHIPYVSTYHTSHVLLACRIFGLCPHTPHTILLTPRRPRPTLSPSASTSPLNPPPPSSALPSYPPVHRYRHRHLHFHLHFRFLAHGHVLLSSLLVFAKISSEAGCGMVLGSDFSRSGLGAAAVAGNGSRPVCALARNAEYAGSNWLRLEVRRTLGALYRNTEIYRPRRLLWIQAWRTVEDSGWKKWS